MDEINSLIFHGCKLARDLELNLPNIANQPNMVLKSCDDIVRIFSAARDRLSGQGSSSTSYGSGGGGGLIHESQMAGIGGGSSGGGGMHEWLRFASSQAMDLLQAQYEVQGGSAEMGGGVDVSGGELGGGSGGGGGGEVQAMDVSDSSRGTSWQRQRRSLIVLIISKSDEYDVSGGDPDLLVHLATGVTQSLGSVDAHGFTTTVSEHSLNLSILLAVFFEDEFAFLIVCFVLTSLSILSSRSRFSL
ncbi:hypothetical protein TEA_016423 [Camellia sinensis var. sinensis]|uniref:Uncharacterized protein n=1 Tax=Camellia sinensis var. sinensis TaxID=542762 RepID=A0A4S4EE50_CAMSN|nr:hypothetical protein TEA_016423 [Camellia sinensis var. sinensis]